MSEPKTPKRPKPRPPAPPLSNTYPPSVAQPRPPDAIHYPGKPFA